ncbi:hypothetical protein GAP32_094 [Cronobacter phage vB_CsaM_GAP32]|uniref:Uncharacterized protein n=1 Tax=Cronobacter phage vB_CsaM_GAP32 TaxID=1141136 RepID=K4F783_9CAUD|nr:hypothetical protein GAP32_094 [Cronobacter phage vB_CsaM_GAP32]AFC21542.1 hypothetical protein GAP32_094 [Cronobacter phage vB_CsaM_GAP32]
MTTIEAIEARIEELASKRAANQALMQPMFKENSALTDEIQELQAQVLKLKSEAIETEEDMIKFYIVNDGCSNGMDHYHARNRFFESIGLRTCGYFPATNQCGFELMLYKDGSNLEQTLSGIEKVLPYIIPIDGEEYDRNKVITMSIFERTCSEYGCYSLVYDVESIEWILSKIAWHRRSELKVFKTLREALEYISANHYYGYDDEEQSDEEEY